MPPVVLDDAMVRGLVSRAHALDIARAALIAQANGQAALSTPAAMSLDGAMAGGPSFKVKAATLGPLRASGIRLLPGKGPAGEKFTNYTAVYDHAEGGGLNGLVAEDWLSRLRTAAFAVATIEGALPNRPIKLGLFGAGAIAHEFVPLLAAIHPIEGLRVWSRTNANAETFARDNAQYVAGEARAYELPVEIIAGADLVVTLTDATAPLVKAGQLGSNAILMSMGSHNEVEYDVLTEAKTLIVDDPDYASNMGDGGAWVKQGRIARDALVARVDLRACELARDFAAGRRHRDLGRTVALIQGMAIGDVAFAVHALRQYRTRTAP